ncbi:hypothetical protein MPTK1_3g00440 [Marchantia polymorpha subsp. ruderalis]|uniref:Uncharacterized protein n=2 Tax=Marchantia polymorpha TaxID=3197 RepID=A0AAF6AVW3_MARPO|nr:hypothetical protein MARPO_0007s0040 [Marchantia polymorpha]BBN03897.1 hypothetical protein Mp_3g00440 [Marchantia polymorpha subsp. ruderalis]|eukprot:PTQ47585.1 hypothetical protein MARPO_0007s0040 [Marchantia polymorpha]
MQQQQQLKKINGTFSDLPETVLVSASNFHSNGQWRMNFSANLIGCTRVSYDFSSFNPPSDSPRKGQGCMETWSSSSRRRCDAYYYRPLTRCSDSEPDPNVYETLDSRTLHLDDPD